MKLHNLVCAATLSAALPLTAVAETTHLLFNSFLAPQHPVTRDVVKPWAEKVAEVTNGRVVVQVAPSSLAAPHQQVNGVRNGVFDMSYQFHGLLSKQVKLNRIAHLPFVNTSSRGSSVALWRTYEKYFAEKNELADVHVLSMFVLPPGAIFGMDEAIDEMSDFEGTKTYAVAGVPAQLAEATGAGVVAAPAARSYEIISGKTVDSFMGYSVSDAFGLKTLNYATHVTDVPGHLSAPSFVLFINKKRWERLSEEDKAAIDSISGEAFAQSMAVYDELEAKARAGAAKNGIEFHNADASFVNSIERIAQPVIDAWKADATEMGLNAEEVLAYFKEQAEANK